MTTLDREVKKQSILDHNLDQFYDCYDEAKTVDILQLMSK